MKPQPMLTVRDVETSSLWYQRVLGLKSGHGGKEYEQLKHRGRMVLQLHRWDVHEHRHLGDPQRKGAVGNGVVVWFQTANVLAAFRRAIGAGAEVLEPIQVNPNAHHREFWLRDPDGYVVVVAGKQGDVG